MAILSHSEVMNFKNLVLDRQLIKSSVNQYDESMTVEILEENDRKHRYSVFGDGISKALIIFHFNNNGKTTIQVTSGSNTELSKQIAEHVVKKCSVAVASKGNFRIQPLTKESFDLLLEYLQTDCQAILKSQKEISGGIQYSIIGRQGDKLTVSFYQRKGTLMIQGNPLMLHSEVVEFLSEILDLKSLIDAQLNLISTNIKASETLKKLEMHLPNSYEFLTDKTKAFLSPCLAFKQLQLELTDYTSLVFPAFRGLESYIKRLFRDKNIIVPNSGFGTFLRSDSHNSLNDNTRNRINCDKTCRAINKCYAYYKTHRNPLFHVDGIVENTRMIYNRQEAESMIMAVLGLIEETYILIREPSS